MVAGESNIIKKKGPRLRIPSQKNKFETLHPGLGQLMNITRLSLSVSHFFIGAGDNLIEIISLDDHSTKCHKWALGRVLMSKHLNLLYFNHLQCFRLKSRRSLGWVPSWLSHLVAWLVVTFMSDCWHFTECKCKALIQVLSLTDNSCILVQITGENWQKGLVEQSIILPIGILGFYKQRFRFHLQDCCGRPWVWHMFFGKGFWSVVPTNKIMGSNWKSIDYAQKSTWSILALKLNVAQPVYLWGTATRTNTPL